MRSDSIAVEIAVERNFHQLISEIESKKWTKLMSYTHQYTSCVTHKLDLLHNTLKYLQDKCFQIYQNVHGFYFYIDCFGQFASHLNISKIILLLRIVKSRIDCPTDGLQ